MDHVPLLLTCWTDAASQGWIVPVCFCFGCCFTAEALILVIGLTFAEPCRLPAPGVAALDVYFVQLLNPACSSLLSAFRLTVFLLYILGPLMLNDLTYGYGSS